MGAFVLGAFVVEGIRHVSVPVGYGFGGDFVPPGRYLRMDILPHGLHVHLGGTRGVVDDIATLHLVPVYGWGVMAPAIIVFVVSIKQGPAVR